MGPVKASPGMLDAERVVALLRVGFKACYKRALDQDPTMSGTAGLDMKVGPGGDVTGVSVSGSKGLSPALVACLSGVARRAQFSRPEGGSATLSIPFTVTR
jgi:hypothetical protein